MLFHFYCNSDCLSLLLLLFRSNLLEPEGLFHSHDEKVLCLDLFICLPICLALPTCLSRSVCLLCFCLSLFLCPGVSLCVVCLSFYFSSSFGFLLFLSAFSSCPKGLVKTLEEHRNELASRIAKETRELSKHLNSLLEEDFQSLEDALEVGHLFLSSLLSSPRKRENLFSSIKNSRCRSRDRHACETLSRSAHYRLG